MNISIDRIEELDDEIMGVCIDCGFEQAAVEPDARNLYCQSCKKFRVFGAMQIVIEGLMEIGGFKFQVQLAV